MKFYTNRGRHCAQAIIKSIATEDSMSLKELDKLTGRIRNGITTPLQIAYGLHRLGINFIYPVKKKFIESKISELNLGNLNLFGENNLRKINFEFIERARKELMESKNYLLRDSFNLKSLEPFMKEGKNPICLINYDKFVGRKNEMNGHYLIIRNIVDEEVIVMDSGPCDADPFKKISTLRLENSLMQTPIDYGLVIV